MLACRGENKVLETYEIDGPLKAQRTGAIEVTVRLRDGRIRWCFLMTPQALAVCGDWIDGTQISFHHGAPHMIVVAGVLIAELIGTVLHQLDAAGELERCTRSIDGREES